MSLSVKSLYNEPLSCHGSNQKDVDLPLSIRHLKSEKWSAQVSRIFLQTQEQKMGFGATQKFLFFRNVEWIHLHHRDSLSVNKIQIYLSMAVRLQSNNLRIPNPPSFLGKQTYCHGTFAPPTPKFGPL